MAQQTKNAIRRAFIQLLNERPLDKISIKDIAEKGAVNRNTFYYYYADIYALVEDILQLEIQDFGLCLPEQAGRVSSLQFGQSGNASALLP